MSGILRELIEEAEAIFRAHDPKYDMRNYPVGLRVGDVCAFFTRDGRRLATTKSSFDTGTSGEFPERTSVCPSAAKDMPEHGEIPRVC